VEGGDRVRFHLERDGDDATTLRFTHEYQGDSEPSWRSRFERLVSRR
jgi:hypothetical protein